MNEETGNQPVELPPEVQTQDTEPVEPVAEQSQISDEQPGEDQTEESEPRSEEEPMAKELKRLDQRFDALEAEFQSKIKYDIHKQKIIDDLHKELQDYKNDQAKSLLRPVIMDIIQTIDDISRLVKSHKEKEPAELDPLKLLKQMEGLGLDLTDILFRQGVEPFRCPQPQLDPKRQKIIKTQPCSQENQDKTVALRIQPGYEWDSRILRLEKVNVFVFKAGSAEPETDTTKENES